METQTLSRRNAPISSIGLLLLLTTTLIGCGVLFDANRIWRLGPVILSKDDLPTMQVTPLRRIDSQSKGPIVYLQEWNQYRLTIQYCLFDSAESAIKAAAEGRSWWFVAAAPKFQSETYPENVIGDATWFHIPSYYNDPSHIWFVKNNVLVHISATGNLSNHRDIARKIEAKIRR